MVGDLRIKVAPAHCGTKVASVALRLSLDEFAEVKYMRPGAKLPPIVKADNQTRPDSQYRWMVRSQDKDEIIYNYTAYDRALGDPALWVVKAEERKTWTTEATLFGSDLDFSAPQVAPFTVVSPAVNYPPAIMAYRAVLTSSPIRRHGSYDLAYNYVALVAFTDGNVVEQSAGHTNFAPNFVKQTSLPSVITAVFRDAANDHGDPAPPDVQQWIEKRERCFPSPEQTVYVGEVRLEGGNTVQRGEKITGRVSINATKGSTTMSRVFLTLGITQNMDWAKREAAAGGDTEFSNNDIRRYSAHSDLISLARTEHLFHENLHELSFFVPSESAGGAVSHDKPYFDFSLEVPEYIAPAFTAYYGSTGANLVINLQAVYSREIARCLDGNHDNGILDDVARSDADAAAQTEEGLWDSHTIVGKPLEVAPGRIQYLQARIPVVVVGNTVSTAPTKHYLSPGAASPVLLSFPADVVFPPLRPVVTEEPVHNTTKRLLPTDRSADPFWAKRGGMSMRLSPDEWAQEAPPDPAAGYNKGNYAGLLWKKKMVAIERGILAPESESTVLSEEGQQPFLTIP